LLCVTGIQWVIFKRSEAFQQRAAGRLQSA
jgi:hypothetical protein